MSLRRTLKECDDLQLMSTDQMHVFASHDETRAGILNILIVFLNHVYFGNIEIELEINYPTNYPFNPFKVELKNEHAIFHPFLWTNKIMINVLEYEPGNRCSDIRPCWGPEKTIRSQCIDPILKWMDLDQWVPDAMEKIEKRTKYLKATPSVQRDAIMNDNEPYQYMVQHGVAAYICFVKQLSANVV